MRKSEQKFHTLKEVGEYLISRDDSEDKIEAVCLATDKINLCDGKAGDIVTLIACIVAGFLENTPTIGLRHELVDLIKRNIDMAELLVTGKELFGDDVSIDDIKSIIESESDESEEE